MINDSSEKTVLRYEMTETKKKIRMPDYFNKFQCIGGGCEDNCCIGWDVEIDRCSFQKYQKVKDQELSKLISSRIFINEDSFDKNVDYAIVQLEKNNRCPFLNEKHLCRIQARLGHDFLSNVCRTYPRYANEVNGVDEYSVNVSCPEAARLILTDKNGIVFSAEDQIPYPGMIINFSVNTNAGNGKILMKYFEELRQLTISMLQNRAYSLSERIRYLGGFYRELEDMQPHKDLKRKGQNIDLNIKKLMASVPEKIAKGKTPESGKLPLQYRRMSEIIEHLNKTTEIDSKRFIRFTEEFSAGLGFLDLVGTETEELGVKGREAAYCIAYEKYYRPFMESREHLMENYLVNYVFGGLFPAAESTRPFEAYMMLVLRYAMIKYYLIGIGAFREGLTEETAVQFIQVFSKAVEHHHTYLQGAMSYIKRKKYGTLSFSALLLQE
jgi:lysine-N-methylase